MKNKIEGKAVVITGASSGLGEATARLLSARSAILVLGARREFTGVAARHSRSPQTSTQLDCRPDRGRALSRQ